MKQGLLDKGMTPNEADTYLYLLKHPRSSAQQVSRGTGIERSLTYSVLNALVSKGLATFHEGEDKRIFLAAPPKTLEKQAESTLLQTKELVKQLQNINPQATPSFEAVVSEGRNALRNMFQLALQEQELLVIGANKHSHEALYEIPHIIEEFEKKDIRARILIWEGEEEQFKEFQNEFNYRKVKGNHPVTINIFGQYVATVSIEDRAQVCLLRNNAVTDTYRTLFNALWNSAEEL